MFPPLEEKTKEKNKKGRLQKVGRKRKKREEKIRREKKKESKERIGKSKVEDFHKAGLKPRV